MYFKLVIVLETALAVLAGAELIIRPAGDSFTKAVGGSIVMTCSIPVNKTASDVTVMWLNNDGIEVSARIGRMYAESENAFTKKLYITGIQTGDAGIYTCRATSASGTVEKFIELQIFRDITFEDTPEVQSVAMHSDALIVCRARGNPAPTVSWRFKGHRIVPGERYIEVTDGLKILGVTKFDDGEYTCRAEVEIDGRYDERRIIVSVHIPPKMKTELNDHEGVQGTDLFISCDADGLPAPTFTFYKNGVQLKSSSRVQLSGESGNIYFSPLHKDDEGSYNCTASNDVGSATSTGSIRVLVPPSVFGVVNAVAVEGEPASISCQSQGDPVPDMSFHKVGQRHVYLPGTAGSRTDGVFVSSPRVGHLQLTFDSVTPDHAGNYTCQSRNAVGEDSQLASLIVQFKPRFHVNQTQQAFAWAGRARNVSCRVDAYPAPEIEWLRNGRRIEPNETFRIYQVDSLFQSTSYLQVRIRETDQSWVYGTYECSAKNSFGQANLDIELRRAAVPDAPKFVSVLERLPTEFVLTARPPDEDGGMPVTGFRVEFEDQVQEFKLDDVPLRITGLKPSTKYILRVRAVSEVGAGSPVLETVITENIRRPYPIVINSDPVGREAFEYTVTWKAPATGGLPVTHYEFQYRRVKVVDGTFNFTEPLEDWISYTEYDNADRPVLRHRLEDLEPDCYYQLEIRARNSMGKSDANALFIFRTASGGDAEPASKRSSLDWNVIIVIAVVVLIIFLVIIDFSCYFMNSCGVTMFICVHVFGQRSHHGHQRGIEEGESEKKPLSDDVPPEVETVTAFQSRSVMVSSLPTEDDDDHDDTLNLSGSERTESQRRVPSVTADPERGPH